MKLSHAIGVLVFCGCAVAAVLLGNRVIPYSLDHFKKINAVKMASIIGIWRKNGSSLDSLRESETSNSSIRVFQFRTNVVFSETQYSTILALEAGSFRRNGILVGTTNREVFWLDREGRVGLIFSPRQSDK